MDYRRPARSHSIELEIRKSRFIADIQPVHDRDDAMRFIESVRALHPKANHHCWAYVAGAPDDAHQWNCSDDGEPKGTAGQPMLNVLRHSHLGNLCAVTTRYFGGVKLGTGGLARAYSQSVQDALSELPTEAVIATVAIRLTAPYTLTGELEHLINLFQLDQCERTFGENLTLTAKLEAHRQQAFEEALIPFQHQITLHIS